MAAPLVNKRVVLSGLAREALNQKRGIAIAYDDKTNRYAVLLESGPQLAIKPANLRADVADAGATAADAPPQQSAAHAAAHVARLRAILARLLERLPTTMSPLHLGLGTLALYFVLGLPALLVAAAGAGVYRMGGLRPAADELGVRLSRITGRDFSSTQASVVALAFAYLVYRFLFLGDASAGDGEPGEAFAAYAKGYEDGRAGARYAPVSDVGAAPGTSAGSSIGIGMLFKLAVLGSMVYNLGATADGWSAQSAMTNARNMQPMQIMVAINLLSSFF